MSEPTKPFKIGSIIWSISITIGVLALGISIILPSTKRSRLHFVPQPGDPATEPVVLQPTTAAL